MRLCTVSLSANNESIFIAQLQNHLMKGRGIYIHTCIYTHTHTCVHIQEPVCPQSRCCARRSPREPPTQWASGHPSWREFRAKSGANACVLTQCSTKLCHLQRVHGVCVSSGSWEHYAKPFDQQLGYIQEGCMHTSRRRALSSCLQGNEVTQRMPRLGVNASRSCQKHAGLSEPSMQHAQRWVKKHAWQECLARLKKCQIFF
jgi:hypothetical protein